MTWDGSIKLTVLPDTSLSSSCSFLIDDSLLRLCLPMNWVPKYPAQSDNVMALVANNAICAHVHLSGNFNMQWMQNLAQIHYFYIIWLGVCEM